LVVIASGWCTFEALLAIAEYTVSTNSHMHFGYFTNGFPYLANFHNCLAALFIILMVFQVLDELPCPSDVSIPFLAFDSVMPLHT
jgi:hypothetical protein